MPELYDTQLRKAALDCAVRVCGKGSEEKEILSTAQKYYEFMIQDSDYRVEEMEKVKLKRSKDNK